MCGTLPLNATAAPFMCVIAYFDVSYLSTYPLGSQFFFLNTGLVKWLNFKFSGDDVLTILYVSSTRFHQNIQSESGVECKIYMFVQFCP